MVLGQLLPRKFASPPPNPNPYPNANPNTSTNRGGAGGTFPDTLTETIF